MLKGIVRNKAETPKNVLHPRICYISKYMYVCICLLNVLCTLDVYVQSSCFPLISLNWYIKKLVYYWLYKNKYNLSLHLNVTYSSIVQMPNR